MPYLTSVVVTVFIFICDANCLKIYLQRKTISPSVYVNKKLFFKEKNWLFLIFLRSSLAFLAFAGWLYA